MGDWRSEATPPEQSKGVIRKNKDSLSRAISKHLIFVLRILSVSLIACLAGGLLTEREKNLRKRARSTKGERTLNGRCQKKWGGRGWLGEWKEGKKGNWGERVTDVFPYVLFSPSPFCACQASYDARALFC